MSTEHEDFPIIAPNRDAKLARLYAENQRLRDALVAILAMRGTWTDADYVQQVYASARAALTEPDA